MAYQYDSVFTAIIDALPTIDIEDPVAARRLMEEMTAETNSELDTSGLHIEDRRIPGPGEHEIPIRMYRALGQTTISGAIVYLHGGGFVFGDLESEHKTAIEICKNTGALVVAVDYRLAPEHPYPAGLEDCYSALCWVSTQAARLQVDPERVALCGNSAGGGLAAALALLCRDRKGPALCFQCLVGPVLDDQLTTHSMQTFTDTPLWRRADAELSWSHYLGAGYTPATDDIPIYAAPTREADLSNLPRAFVSANEFDPLRDEAIDYATRLIRSGVSVELHTYPGTFHGCQMLIPDAGVCSRMNRDMFDALERALRVSDG